MNSIAYPEDNIKKKFSRQLAKVAVLLIIALSLLWFSINFPFYRIFEPQSIGWVLWVSYAKDLIQPFAFYFLLCLADQWLNTWQKRALLALAVPTLLELRQALYHPIGQYIGAFDLLDIVMYAIGVGLAVLLERKVFAKHIKFW